jgi:hypothetical protein
MLYRLRVRNSEWHRLFAREHWLRIHRYSSAASPFAYLYSWDQTLCSSRLPDTAVPHYIWTAQYERSLLCVCGLPLLGKKETQTYCDMCLAPFF